MTQVDIDGKKDAFIIFYQESRGGKLNKVNPAKWSALPETDPVLGVASCGWSLGPSVTNERWVLRAETLRSSVAETLLKSKASKGGYGVNTSDPILLADSEWSYLVDELLQFADRENQGLFGREGPRGGAYVVWRM